MTVFHSIHVPAIRGAVLAWVVIWFVLGYILYATIYGALGSLGSRVEERINEHLELCGLCAEAHKRRRSNASRRHLHLSYASV